jgi:preprotein translocase subunit SecE
LILETFPDYAVYKGRRFNHDWRITVPDIRAARQEMNIFQRFWHNIQKFFQETGSELRKVSWPTRQEAIRLTQIVLVVIFIMAAILGGLDYVYAKFFGLILGG